MRWMVMDKVDGGDDGGGRDDGRRYFSLILPSCNFLFLSFF